jgi:hypothetical protein
MMAKALKKTAKPAKVRVALPPYRLRTGTRSELGETINLATIPKLKEHIVKDLKQLRVWCERHNLAGLEAIDKALAETDSLMPSTNPQRLSLCFDEYTNMWYVAEYWRQP